MTTLLSPRKLKFDWEIFEKWWFSYCELQNSYEYACKYPIHRTFLFEDSEQTKLKKNRNLAEENNRKELILKGSSGPLQFFIPKGLYWLYFGIEMATQLKKTSRTYTEVPEASHIYYQKNSLGLQLKEFWLRKSIFHPHPNLPQAYTARNHIPGAYVPKI